jgi:hypothetical protein
LAYDRDVAPKPYLPQQQVDQHQPARSAGKTVILWLLLILMFVAIYQVFSSAPPPRGETPPSGGVSAGWIIGGGALSVVIAVFAYLSWVSRSVRRYNDESAEALRLLSRSDLGAALKQFEALAARWKRPRSIRAVARHNVAWALLRSGELARAIDAYSEIERTGVVAGIGGVWHNVACHLAIAHALSGDLDTAQQWLDEAVKRIGQGGDTRHLRGVAALGRAIIECRRGGGAGVARELERDWAEFESALTGEILRPLRLVRAFAVAHDGGLRGQGTVEMLVVPLRGGPPGELAFLGQSWPEMKGFLTAHAL